MAIKIDPWKPPGSNEVEMASVVALYRQGLAAQTPSTPRSAVVARARLEEWFTVPKTVALVAKALTGKVEGLLAFRNEANGVRIIYLAALEHRRGIGSKLVTALKDLCARKGIKEIRTVYCEKDARASAFFAKHGFAGRTSAGEAAPGFPLVEGCATTG